MGSLTVTNAPLGWGTLIIGGDCEDVETGSIWELPVLSAQFTMNLKLI